jgi:hypothetical protein
MRSASWASLGVLVLVLAGCGKTTEQLAAISAVRAAAGAKATQVRCSRSASAGPYAGSLRTDVFICAARFRGGGCEGYLATRKRGRFVVRVYPRNHDCTVPP